MVPLFCVLPPYALSVLCSSTANADAANVGRRSSRPLLLPKCDVLTGYSRRACRGVRVSEQCGQHVVERLRLTIDAPDASYETCVRPVRLIREATQPNPAPPRRSPAQTRTGDKLQCLRIVRLSLLRFIVGLLLPLWCSSTQLSGMLIGTRQDFGRMPPPIVRFVIV